MIAASDLRALVMAPDTAFGHAAGKALSLLGFDQKPAGELSLLVLPAWTGDSLSESRAFVAEILKATGDLAPALARSGRGVIIHPLSLSALAPFGDENDAAHRAALAAAQLNRAWFAPLGVRVAQLFIDRLDMTSNRADRSAQIDPDGVDIGLRHVLAGADQAFRDPAALAVWQAVNGDW
ncbi:hypothetical protein [Caulobacter sp. FWC2]|uniref:hypothetical protein n=1 Tax=Caulobacter sp. FWC2 TaxID=69664 RepID=UPI000C14B1A5|nr:hypothetical protein [Caulobacter sp. FWC2]PIB93439.1 hypothetical protein CSW62_18770 [Caulobacter sp. FWC2]